MNNRETCNKIILPCCPDYDAKRQIFNRSVQRFPCAIVYCENEEDIREAVLYAAKRGLDVRIRSGGHNYEGFCTGNGKLVIDTSRLKEMALCRNCNTVQIGSGVSNRELYQFLSQNGYPFASGTCPTVNAVGLTQGGGWGHSARMFGLTCDQLTGAKLVDARGDLIAASETCRPGLFWGLRGGGGGNFGVITKLRYKLPPKCAKVTYIDIQYSSIQEKTALRFFQIWQEWVKTAEIRFTPNSRIFNSEQDGPGIFLRGFFYGTPKEASASVQPFLSVPGAKASFQYVTFLEATEIDASFYPEYETFRFAGRFSRGDYSDAQIEALLRLIRERAPGSIYASIALYALGGRVRDAAPTDTAFYFRNADYIMGLETVWRSPKAQADNLAWLKRRFPVLRALTAGSYINFPYLCTENYMQAYYGGNAERLTRLKHMYDPRNLFCFPQSIRSY